MPPSWSSPWRKAVATSGSLHSKPRQGPCSGTGCISRLPARRVSIYLRCSRPLRLREPPRNSTPGATSQLPFSAPIRCRGCLAHERLDKADSDLAWETSVHETPVLLSILEGMHVQLGTEEEPEPPTLSLTAQECRSPDPELVVNPS